jgi:short-subunit dehydrogenase
MSTPQPSPAHPGTLVLVTGASAGIGRATAVRLAREGHLVAMVARDEAALEAARDEVGHAAANARCFPADLSDAGQATALVERIERSFDRPIDVLVDCAARSVLGDVADVPLEKFRESFAVNFFSPLALTKALLPRMLARRSGHLIFFTSGAGRRGLPGVAAYCATKFALTGFIESLRVEVLGHGIRVSAVSPGVVKTEIFRRAERYGAARDRADPAGGIEPEQVAAAVARLIRDPRRELNLSWRSQLGVRLNAVLPGLLDRMLAKKHHRP